MAWQPKQPARKPGERPSTAKPRTLLLVALGFLAVLLVSQLVRCDPGNAGPASNYQPRIQQACRDAVRAKLKDPASARFSDERVRISSDAKPVYRYTVSGSVTGANSLGGKAVAGFACDVSWDTSSGNAEATATLVE